jgi:hypothetical protein
MNLGHHPLSFNMVAFSIFPSSLPISGLAPKKRAAPEALSATELKTVLARGQTSASSSSSTEIGADSTEADDPTRAGARVAGLGFAPYVSLFQILSSCCMFLDKQFSSQLFTKVVLPSAPSSSHPLIFWSFCPFLLFFQNQCPSSRAIR